MEQEIYTINHLAINQSKREFCISYNNGLKTFDLDNFKEKYSSNNFEFKLGSISLSIMVPKENIVIFVGTKNNIDYPNNKIVFFDIGNKKVLFSKTFDSEITQIKYVNNFLYICFGFILRICIYDTEDSIEFNEKAYYTLSKEYTNLFEVWETSNNTQLCLAYPCKNQIIILFNTADDWKLGNNKKNIDIPVNKIQNLFFIKKLNQLFICDEKANYIYGFDVEDGSMKLCLKRGIKDGLINSITLLNDNFLAVNNLNKTIHIFDLDINNNSFSFSNLISDIFYGIKEISSCIRIYYKDFMTKEERSYYQSDFDNKGEILSSEDYKNELNVIAYNGYAFKIEINFKDFKYNIIKKENYAQN